MKEKMLLLPALGLIIIAAACITMKKRPIENIFPNATDIGHVKNHGTVDHETENEKYILTGSGTNMWKEKDDLFFVWRKVKSNFLLTTKVNFPEPDAASNRKAGLIIRQSLDPGSPYVSASYYGNGRIAMQYRSQKDSVTREFRATEDSLDVLRLIKKGNTITMEAARNGMPLDSVGHIKISLSPEVYVGLFVCAHDPAKLEKAVFTNTRLVVPAKEDFIPYQDYIGSRIEVLNIETGQRKIVCETDSDLEAPNWSCDGKFLVLNGKGKLYKLTLADGSLTMINTDFAIHSNNDHGISHDGAQLVISDHSPDLPHDVSSLIYILPINGGFPRQITSNGPSYWHGWSPNGKYLIYTANRNDRWNIYRIPVDGGKEIQLTNTASLDDGPEYSTEGKSIWFNSNRTGSMEIWRMKADGSEPEQITNDNYQNWFPHQSPDGKWLIFLSYPPEVDAGDHPYYKKVMLRLMPTTGEKPRIIAYLYGGQGTINVPSWSPDSKEVAFVSNSDKIE